MLLSEEEEGGERNVWKIWFPGLPVMGSVPEPFISRPGLEQRELRFSVIRFGGPAVSLTQIGSVLTVFPRNTSGERNS